jgi:cell fate regulator YaaT (PSP1 superfamily)
MKVALVEFAKIGSLVPFLISETEDFSADDKVVAGSERGLAIGTIRKIVDSNDTDLKPILRKATENDFSVQEENRKIATSASHEFRKEVKKLGLEMKLVKAEYTLDRSKIVFYFTAEKRIDFRLVVRILASIFKTRIEMRQIGVRDKAKMIGGIGLCGQEQCCSKFLRQFGATSVKMAKDQNLNLNVHKISGACGRLMCCLAFENGLYEDFLKYIPPIGKKIKVGDLEGEIIAANPFKRTVIIRSEKKDYEVEAHLISNESNSGELR